MRRFVCCLSLFSSFAFGSDNLIQQAGYTGGIIVHLDCNDGTLTAQLANQKRTLVHALDTDAKDVDAARDLLKEGGLYGNASVEAFDGKTLPYVDNLINLIVCEGGTTVPEAEIMRVLCPLGVALIDGKKTVKPWPDTIDEWNHYLHGADNNAVAKDRSVAMPRALQWVAKPKWGRSHEQMASMSVAVSAKGRFFTIVDEAPLASVRYPADWKLVARDAFNGTLLWKRDVTQWIDHLRHFRSGPVHLPRRMVAIGDRVYVTLGLSGSLLALDAATGETFHTYEGTENTEEILFDQGSLFLVIGTSETERTGGGLSERGEPKPTGFRKIFSIDAASGKKNWEQTFGDAEYLMPSTLAIKGDYLFYQSTVGVVSLSSKTGELRWKTPRLTPNKRMGYSAPTLVATEDVLLCADRIVAPNKKAPVEPAKGPPVWGVHGWSQAGFDRKGKSELIAYDVADGKELWKTSCAEGYNAPVDVFVVDGTVWVGTSYAAYDLKTGEEKAKIKTRGNEVSMPHHRCYRNKASERFIFTGWSGIEVIDLEKGWLGNNSWVRGTCQYGIMPSNGMLYAPPDACACNPAVKMPGFVALTPQRGKDGHIPFPEKPVLEKGPAFGKIKAKAGATTGWPMYRRDNQRGGKADKLPATLAPQWKADLGGTLTQAIAAEGKVFLASIDAHTVFALDAGSGKEAWTYTTGGRIDSAPTFYKGCVYFGSADGWITAVRAEDGELAWRFRAAPQDQRISVYGQLESIWPVHGSILIQDDTIYATAGRSSYLDGGLIMYRLDPATGEAYSRNLLYHIDPETDAQVGTEKARSFTMEGTMSDILTGDGESVFMRETRFNASGEPIKDAKPHLFSVTGLLGEEWYVRSYWMIGTTAGAGWGRWAQGANKAPSGRILSFDDEEVFGYGRKTVAGGATGHKADEYHLFSASRNPVEPPTPEKKPKGKKKPPARGPNYTWSTPADLHIRGMVSGPESLIVAGPIDKGKKTSGLLSFEDGKSALEAFSGDAESKLRMVSAETGKTISEVDLDGPPVFDGVSVADGQVLVSLKNGTLVSLGE